MFCKKLPPVTLQPCIHPWGSSSTLSLNRGHLLTRGCHRNELQEITPSTQKAFISTPKYVLEYC